MIVEWVLFLEESLSRQASKTETEVRTRRGLSRGGGLGFRVIKDISSNAEDFVFSQVLEIGARVNPLDATSHAFVTTVHTEKLEFDHGTALGGAALPVVGVDAMGPRAVLMLKRSVEHADNFFVAEGTIAAGPVGMVALASGKGP